MGWICKACMHLVAAPFPVQLLLRHCMLHTPPPLTVEASSQTAKPGGSQGCSEAIGQGDEWECGGHESAQTHTTHAHTHTHTHTRLKGVVGLVSRMRPSCPAQHAHLIPPQGRSVTHRVHISFSTPVEESDSKSKHRWVGWNNTDTPKH